MDTTVDLLKIKIEKAKRELPEESRSAIDAVDWKTAILEMRTEKGYSYAQLEDLEIETELLLCGLISTKDYPKEIEKRLNIPRAQVNELVNEMNEKVFKKIREQLVKNIDSKKVIENIPVNKTQVEKTESVVKKETPSILSQKLSGSFQIPTVETEHSLSNMTKDSGEDKMKSSKVDPYRMSTE